MTRRGLLGALFVAPLAALLKPETKTLGGVTITNNTGLPIDVMVTTYHEAEHPAFKRIEVKTHHLRKDQVS